MAQVIESSTALRQRKSTSRLTHEAAAHGERNCNRDARLRRVRVDTRVGKGESDRGSVQVRIGYGPTAVSGRLSSSHGRHIRLAFCGDQVTATSRDAVASQC
ncbi:uncharacterized protein PSANT_04382 [Moesziomyces antarcticus]|uniref:Uncharacterized protein n=1 Tax=Pseudozyma antarctica TaxID=84753 RepID=A0A5C3FR92_PSEA2|nr:uncharacterized protein PSANT_04382 [Moesziomyces antarcticus]